MDKKPVIITTEYRGVFFGYIPADALPNQTEMDLERARMCVYWDTSTKGVTKKFNR